jgi:hypothetical protein
MSSFQDGSQTSEDYRSANRKAALQELAKHRPHVAKERLYSGAKPRRHLDGVQRLGEHIEWLAKNTAAPRAPIHGFQRAGSDTIDWHPAYDPSLTLPMGAVPLGLVVATPGGLEWMPPQCVPVVYHHYDPGAQGFAVRYPVEQFAARYAPVRHERLLPTEEPPYEPEYGLNWPEEPQQQPWPDEFSDGRHAPEAPTAPAPRRSRGEEEEAWQSPPSAPAPAPPPRPPPQAPPPKAPHPKAPHPKMPPPLAKFRAVFEVTEKDNPHHFEERDALWPSFDGNGSGYASLAECCGGVLAHLSRAYGREGEPLYRRYYRSYIRAYSDAKDAAQAVHPRDDDYVTRSEFRLLLVYLGIYATWAEVFMYIIDENGDHRLSRDEWVRGLPRAREAGETWADSVALSSASEASFDEMDQNGGGFIDLQEFCEWVEAAEKRAGTHAGLELGVNEPIDAPAAYGEGRKWHTTPLEMPNGRRRS